MKFLGVYVRTIDFGDFVESPGSFCGFDICIHSTLDYEQSLFSPVIVERAKCEYT